MRLLPTNVPKRTAAVTTGAALGVLIFLLADKAYASTIKPPKDRYWVLPGSDADWVSPHFRASEFAQPNGVPYPVAWIESRLKRLVDVLERLRDELGGRPITVVSGYRSQAYNASIGGVRYSQHTQGRAADIVVDGLAPRNVYDTLLQLRREGKIKVGGLGLYSSFVHVDVREADQLATWSGN